MKVRHLGSWVKLAAELPDEELQAFAKRLTDEETVKAAKKVPQYRGVRPTRINIGHEGKDFTNNLITVVMRFETLRVNRERKTPFTKSPISAFARRFRYPTHQL